MNTFTIFVTLAIVALSSVSAYDIIEDENGHQYYLVSSAHNRQRRQTSIDISRSGPGTRVTAGHRGTLFNNGVHRFDGGASVSRQFRPTGPTTLGGNLGYSHVPSGSNFNLGAANTRGFGTDVSATGTLNLWRQGNTRLDAVGSYDRHFGGVGGTGKPDSYGGLQFEHKFN